MTQAADYDTLYEQDDATYDNPRASPYYRLFRRVTDIAVMKPIVSVLEVGCGSGVLAELLIRNGMAYRGFDFNRIAVEKAKRRNGIPEHYVADATSPYAYITPPSAYPGGAAYDAIVCCEVLEHIPGDLEAIKLWRSGATVIASVPNFPYETHVRHFRNEDEIRRRYGHLIDIEWIERITKSPWTGLSWSHRFKRLRWARENPRELAGMLGINRFNWYAGWFLIVGRRR